MPAPHAQSIIDGYLARLDAAIGPEASAARADLIAEVSSHIAEARAGLTDETDADLLNILDRLGEPSMLAADVADAPAAPVEPARPRPPRFAGTAVAAILVLCVGPLLVGPIFSWIGALVVVIPGLTLARVSGEWSNRDINLAGLLSIIMAIVVVAPVLAIGGAGRHWFLVMLMLGPAIAIVPGGIFLALRARSRWVATG